MARAYGDDLRRKFLRVYDQGEETLGELADRFLVSLGWAKKISAQRKRSGQAERVPHRPGRKPHAGPEAQQQVRDWIEVKPDLTLAEIQAKLLGEAGAGLLYLPPYSPDLNPIEKAWAKLKELLRAAQARTREALEQAIADALQRITPENAKAWFKHCSEVCSIT